MFHLSPAQLRVLREVAERGEAMPLRARERRTRMVLLGLGLAEHVYLSGHRYPHALRLTDNGRAELASHA